MLTPEARTTPETSHRLCEVQEKNKTKQNKTKQNKNRHAQSLHTKNTLTNSGLLFYMYFLLIVTSKTLMQSIKP